MAGESGSAGFSGRNIVPQRALIPGKAGPALMRQSSSSSALAPEARPSTNTAHNRALLLFCIGVRGS